MGFAVLNSPLCQDQSLDTPETSKGVWEAARKVWAVEMVEGRTKQQQLVGQWSSLHHSLHKAPFKFLSTPVDVPPQRELLLHGCAILIACGKHEGYEHCPERMARRYLSWKMYFFLLSMKCRTSLRIFHHLVLSFLKETLESFSSFWIEKCLEEGRQTCFYSKIKWFIQMSWKKELQKSDSNVTKSNTAQTSVHFG